MDNFIYSVNATFPVFFVIVIGYFLKQKGMLDDHFANVANKFNFKVTLPALLIQDIGSASLKESFDGGYVLFCMIATSVAFWSVWGLAKLLIKDKSIIGAFVQASFRGSAAILGIAFIQNIYGNSGRAPLMIIGAVPLYNIYSVIVLTFEARQKEGCNIKKAVINIIKNPIIIGIFIGLLVSCLDLYNRAPVMIVKSLHNFAVIASPLALLTIGVTFKGKEALQKIKPTIWATMIKLVILPLLLLPVAVWLGYRNQELVAILIMLGSPTTASCYIMAKNMDNDEVLTSSIIVLATLLSSISLTFWIYILKTFGYL